MDRYRPPHPENWQGRSDEAPMQRFHQHVKLVDLAATDLELPTGALGIVGFVCDEGIKRNHGRVGAAEGPAAIRQALAKLPLPCPDLYAIDVGDVICIDNDLESSQKALAEVVALLLNSGCKPLILGGGHELAWGSYQGIKKAQLHTELTIVNIDAHYDLRTLIDGKHGSSGTSFLQIAREREGEALPFHYVCVGIQESGNIAELFESAKQLGVQTLTAEAINQEGVENTVVKLKAAIDLAEKVHLSICMDVFAAAYAPGVSAPQPLGLTPWQVIPLLKAVTDSKKVISIEIAEVSPPYDRDSMTSRLAATLVYYSSL